VRFARSVAGHPRLDAQQQAAGVGLLRRSRGTDVNRPDRKPAGPMFSSSRDDCSVPVKSPQAIVGISDIRLVENTTHIFFVS
jgi:hypothetical protein